MEGRKAARSPRPTYVSTGARTSLGLTTGMGSSFSEGVLPASRQIRIDSPTVAAISSESPVAICMPVRRA